MSPMGAPAASGASRDPLDIETGQVSGRLVTISGKYRFYFSSSCSKKICLNNIFLIVIVGTCTESISIDMSSHCSDLDLNDQKTRHYF